MWVAVPLVLVAVLAFDPTFEAHSGQAIKTILFR